MLKTASNIGRRRRSFVETPEGLVQALSFYYCSHRLSAVPDILDRVVAIAPVPLLPGEKEADYAKFLQRVWSAPRGRRTRSKNFWSATSSTSLGRFFVTAEPSRGFESSMSDGVRIVLDGLGHGGGEMYGYTRELVRVGGPETKKH